VTEAAPAPAGRSAEPRGLRRLSLAGFAIAALAVVLAPWYRLDDYVPNGWDATWWARAALLAALAGLALASAEAARGRLPLASAEAARGRLPLGSAEAARGRLPLARLRAARLRAALAAVAAAAIAFRLAVPPDFGFAFDGLEVPTERRVGAPLALAGALLALGAELALERRARSDPSPGSPRSGTAAEASASGPAGPAPA
jgi:hypothetical protein